MKSSNKILKLGEYEHYKGKHYRVHGMAKHSETLEEMVVYQALYGKGELWVRPRALFEEEVEANGKKVPRFKYQGDRQNNVITLNKKPHSINR